jgi:hypothetical protein
LKYWHHTCTATAPQEFEKHRIYEGDVASTIFEYCSAWALYYSRQSYRKLAALLPTGASGVILTVCEGIRC